MTSPKTPQLEDLEVPQHQDIPEDVIPLFGSQKEKRQASRGKIAYDILTLVLLMIDLLIIFVDNILMSGFITKIAEWGGFAQHLSVYQQHHHLTLSAVGGFFTIFWVTELSVRWLLAIKKRTYYRWFFFPFVHWYEVLACFPVLRALRLLRAGLIIRRLHGMDVLIIPDKWVNSAKFYYHVVLEELSDRVILTATDNFRQQMANTRSDGELIQATIDKNRAKLEEIVLGLLRAELAPKLQAAFLAQTGQQLSEDIGRSVEQALLDTPELHRYLKMIPIAGSLIEAQITHVGKHIGENVTQAVNQHLFETKTLDTLMVNIAQGVANIDTRRPDLQQFVGSVVDDALTAFENQVRIQQWKHKKQLQL